MERGQGLDHSENADWTGNGKNYFLGIGIDSYQHWDPLNNAVKDVNDLVAVLTRQYQFEQDEIHTLFNRDATEGRIYNKIRELKRILQPQDNLLVYYSGHGHYDDEFEEGYWIPVDAEKDTEDRFISNANIIKRINALNTHHTLLIVDSCFSGTLVVKKRSGLTDERFKSRRILASGRQETVADGRPGENSPFAAGIITYLKKNTEKAINTTMLVQYVKDYVETKARQTPVEGRIQNSSDEGGEFVFHLKVDEQSLWESVKEKDTAEAYDNYLDYYPNGLFAAQADRRILELKEDDIWRSAKIKDSELAYENYLKKYAPGGKFVSQANDRLQALQAALQERQSTLDAMAKKQEERDRIRKEYDGLISEAESLFANKELPRARERYRDALRYYMPGFVPNSDYIDEQISFCSNGITFLNHYENGRKAMDNYNYRLALQYFGEALKVDDNPKVEDLIRYCRLKLEGANKTAKEEEGREKWKTELMDDEPPVQKQEEATYLPPQEVYQKPESTVKKKKSKLRLPLILSGVFVVAILIALAIDNADRDNNNYESPGNSALGITDYPEIEEPTVANSPPVKATPAPTFANLIIGNWQLTTFYSNDAAANSMLQMMNGMQANYTFYNNGQMTVNGTFGSTNAYYYLDNEQISIPGVIESGRIDQLNRNQLTLTSFFNENGYFYSITFEFRRAGQE